MFSCKEWTGDELEGNFQHPCGVELTKGSHCGLFVPPQMRYHLYPVSK